MDNKAHHHGELEARLHESLAGIELLTQKQQDTEAARETSRLQEIESLRVQHQDLHEKLEELRSASEEAWEEMKNTLESGLHRLEKGLANLMKNVKQ